MTAITDRQLMRALAPALRETLYREWMKGEVVQLDIYDHEILTEEALMDGSKLLHRYRVSIEFGRLKKSLEGQELEDLPRVRALVPETDNPNLWYGRALDHLLGAV